MSSAISLPVERRAAPSSTALRLVALLYNIDRFALIQRLSISLSAVHLSSFSFGNRGTSLARDACPFRHLSILATSSLLLLLPPTTLHTHRTCAPVTKWVHKQEKQEKTKTTKKTEQASEGTRKTSTKTHANPFQQQQLRRRTTTKKKEAELCVFSFPFSSPSKKEGAT